MGEAMKFEPLCAGFILALCLTACAAPKSRVPHFEKTEDAVAELVRAETSTVRFEAGLRALGAKISPGDRIGRMLAVIPPPPSKGGGLVTSVCVKYHYLPDDRFVYESTSRIELHTEP